MKTYRTQSDGIRPRGYTPELDHALMARLDEKKMLAVDVIIYNRQPNGMYLRQLVQVFSRERISAQGKAIEVSESSMATDIQIVTADRKLAFIWNGTEQLVFAGGALVPASGVSDAAPQPVEQPVVGNEAEAEAMAAQMREEALAQLTPAQRAEAEAEAALTTALDALEAVTKARKDAADMLRNLRGKAAEMEKQLIALDEKVINAEAAHEQARDAAVAARAARAEAENPVPVGEEPAPAATPAPVTEESAPAPAPAPVAEVPAPAATPAPVAEESAPAPAPAPVTEVPAPAPAPTSPAPARSKPAQAKAKSKPRPRKR